MPAITAAERLSSFASRKVKRLFLSTSEVTLALPASLRKISRSASQCPNACRSSTSAGRFWIQRSRGIGVLRGRRPWRLPRRRRAFGRWRGRLSSPASGPQARREVRSRQAHGPPPLRPVDVAVDRLVADRRPAVRLASETPRDLLRRPAGLQALGHVGAQALVGGQLATSLPASAGEVLGGQGEVAAEAAVAVAEAVAAELAVDRGRVAAEPLGDLADRGAGLDHTEEGAAFIEVELAVGPGQKAPPRCNSLGRLGIRTSR